jgi:hypothetical protein
VDDGKVSVLIDHSVLMRDTEWTCKEHNHAHLKIVRDQSLLRKTPVIGSIKVDGGLVWVVGPEKVGGPISLNLLLNFFFSRARVRQEKKSGT